MGSQRELEGKPASQRERARVSCGVTLRDLQQTFSFDESLARLIALSESIWLTFWLSLAPSGSL